MKMPLEHKIREFNRMYMEVDEAYHGVSLKAGLSDSSFLILYSIAELGDGCLQIEIAKRYSVSKQTVSSSVRALEKKGYLYLKHGKKRDMHLYLTAEGEQMVQKYVIPVMEVENSVFSELTPEEGEELLRLTGKYTEIMKEKMQRI